jgi:hypothetical protein
MRYIIAMAVVGVLLPLGHLKEDDNPPRKANENEPVKSKEKSAAIPQNPEKQEQRFKDMLDWNQRTLLDAYEKVGKKDARWDKPAREALAAAARYFSRQLTLAKAVYDAARQAVEGGTRNLSAESFASASGKETISP